MRNIRAVFLILMCVLCFVKGGYKGLAEQEENNSITSDRVMMTEDMLVGDWKDTPGGYVGNFYCFYNDGSFKYIFSSAWDALDPRINMEGTWRLEKESIIVRISSLTIYEGGFLKYDGSTGYEFEDGHSVTHNLDAELVREYVIENLFEEKTEDDEYYEGPFTSKLTMKISRPFEYFKDYQLWKYSDFPSPRNQTEEAAYDEALKSKGYNW